MTLTRRFIALGLPALLFARPAIAHHGWRWTDDGRFELRGLITEARLGNPHGILTIDAEGEIWKAEVGQPWRNERAGLTDAMLAPSTDIKIIGKRAADPEERLVKAEAIELSGALFELYPERL